MKSDSKTKLGRRAVLMTPLAALPIAALPVSQVESDAGHAVSGDPTQMTARTRLPTVYIPHGGGPWPFVDLGMDRGELDNLSDYLKGLRNLPQTPPKSIVVVSAHWEEKVPTVMSSEHPPMLYDYYGFPPDAYQITWPAPGNPGLAARVESLLGAAGFTTASNAERGFDHGAFVPLKVIYPDASIPTVQLSLKEGLDPEEHLAMGRALAPLRDEGVFLIGSGMSYHNMRGFRDGTGKAASLAFDEWLREASQLPEADRNARLAKWSSAPSARSAHPREEHLMPLMVIAGAAGADIGTIGYNKTLLGARVSAIHFG
jgi:aromatic ring-opening dioxygenase catalytic subunit (LigB family)